MKWPALTAFWAGLLACNALMAEPLEQNVLGLARAWDHAAFEIADAKSQSAALKKLEVQAEAIVAQHPDSAAPIAWKAVILTTQANITEGLEALTHATNAKKLFERAAARDPNALGDGSLYAMLGTLYAQAPGFPVGFGDKVKARKYLLKALEQNPNGIEANYFYADYLVREGEFAKAQTALRAALNAPPRADRAIGDQGRRADAAALMSVIADKPAKRD